MLSAVHRRRGDGTDGDDRDDLEQSDAASVISISGRLLAVIIRSIFLSAARR